MPFVTHCGVTCNPTSGERLREATYSKGEAMPTCANPHLIGADLVLPHEALNEALRGSFELYSWLRAEKRAVAGVERNSQRGSSADGPAEGVSAPQPVTTVTCIDPSDSV